MSDIRDKTIDELKCELEFYKGLIQESYNWEYMQDNEGNFIYVSPSVHRITGFKPEDFYKDKHLLNKIIHPEDKLVFENHKNCISDNGERKLVDFRIITADGNIEWIGHNCRNVYTKNGCLNGIRGSNRVINEKKLLELSYTELSDIHTSIINQVPLGITTYDKNGDCIFANSSMAKIVGASHDQLMNQNYHQISSWKESGLYDAIIDSKGKSEPVQYQLEVISSFGKHLWLNCTIVHLRTSNKAELMVLVEDITQRKTHELELIESKDVKRTLLNASEEPAFLINKDAQFLAMNTAGAKYLNSKVDELIGKCAYDIIPAEFIKLRKKEIEKVFESGEHIIRTDEKNEQILETSIFPVVNSENEVYQAAIYSKDITKEISATRKLKDSEERFRAISTQMKDGITMVNQDGRYVYVNPAFCKMTGYSNEELLNLTLFDMKADKNTPNVTFNELVQKGSSEREGIKLKRKDNSIFDARVSAQHIQIGDNNYYLGLISDITEQLKNEQEIKDTKEKLTHFINSTPAGMFFWGLKKPMPLELNTDDRYEWIKQYMFLDDCNDTTAKEYGYENSDDIRGLMLYDIFLRKDEMLRPAFELFNKYEYSVKDLVTVEINKQEDNFYLINNTSAVIKDNHLCYMQGTSTNITEKIELEKELEKALSEKDKFISIISHDLRIPLSSILGFHEIFVKYIQSGNYEHLMKIVDVVFDTTRKTLDLLENLLNLARFQQNKIPFDPENSSMKEIVNNSYIVIEDMARQKSINYNLDVINDGTVFVDRNMIETVIRNLLSNAIKFTHENGNIQVEIFTKDNKVYTAISDTGVGIHETQLKKLFDSEFMVTTPGTNGEKGTGLGLSFCKDFIEKNNGSISVESELDKGSTFTVEFPLLQDDSNLPD
ncbi:MAG: PAS domain S-box protein [Bacteroidales bacterium]|nr:PAS domain S-box protein [Bacteroidales bacterium]